MKQVTILYALAALLATISLVTYIVTKQDSLPTPLLCGFTYGMCVSGFVWAWVMR